MKKLNKTGPSTDPWGTPLVTGLQELTMSPLRMSGQEQISLMGAATGQINWFPAVCAADSSPSSESSSQHSLNSQGTELQHLVSTACGQALNFCLGMCPDPVLPTVGKRFLLMPRVPQFSELLYRFQGRLLDEKFQMGIPTQTSTNVGCAIYLLEQHHKTLATFL